jgi:hypothetical protein
MKTIGKNFFNELKTAGLAGLPFSWQDDGILSFSAAMTHEQIEAVNAVYEAHNPAAAAVEISKSVTMRQARLALLQAGMLSTVNAAVAGMAGAAGEAARIEWEYSQEVQRDKALVKALAPVLGMTDTQLDNLFIAAAAL